MFVLLLYFQNNLFRCHQRISISTWNRKRATIFSQQNDMKQPMQFDAERTLHNLHVLSVLSHNDKLMTNADTFDIYAPTSLRGLFRTWYGEKRMCNLQRVQDTVRSAMAFASKFLDDANVLLDVQTDSMRLRIHTIVVQHIRMCDGMERAKYGLFNLTKTYQDDPALISQIRFIVTEIDDFIMVMHPHSLMLQRRCAMPIHSRSQDEVHADNVQQLDFAQ